MYTIHIINIICGKCAIRIHIIHNLNVMYVIVRHINMDPIEQF